ncbi:S8 family serine peptidase [Pendulispora brunnea]|uniref:S8 family serine peptidase n=1 Tax=Pendulispora brunnea TaxID=2905690 RepID=A0ABZ2K0J6_9BACT
MAVSVAACSDSSGPAGEDPEPRIAQAGLTTSGWNKLDATLRTRSLLASNAPNATTAVASPPVSIFVQSKDPEATRRIIEAAGGTVGTVAGDVMTARVPPEAIAGIANDAIVSRMEGGLPVRTKLDKAAVAVRADQVHAGASPLSSAYKGEGVIVGVVDNGMDLKHAAFKKANGNTRVRAIWDQGTKGRFPAGYKYGSECDAAEIDARQCSYTALTAYHGTHVMGIAAGGAVQGVPYVGMAPESELVFVDLGTPPDAGSFEEAFSTAVCDGVSYIFKIADAANKPAVVNLSLGEHTGPHDGSSLADKCLDNLIKPGRLVVASAGNEGRGTINPLGSTPVAVHATGTASATPIVVRWLPGRARGKDGQSFAEQVVSIWSDAGSDLAVRVGFVAAPGATPAYSKAVSVDRPLQNTLISDGTTAVGAVGGFGSVSSPSGARNIFISMIDTDADHKEEQVLWLLEITGKGKFDAFIDTTLAGGFLLADNDPALTVNHEMTIGYPAIASKVLAVGSFTTRNTWTTTDGVEHLKKDVDGKVVNLGALSTFSSHGPSRNGVGPMKPDIAAPGELLVSALNGGVSPSAVRTERVVKSSPDGYAAFEGTSMSSPAAAGVVALMLQRNPQLTVEDVRGILSRTAVKPDGATVPSATWGYGKLDALAAMSDSKLAPPNDSKDDGKVGCNVSSTGSVASGVTALGIALGMVLVRRRRRGCRR